MPLDAIEPQLDDRTFDQIMADLRFRIPRYTKEWTNFNDSDPGTTLLQLFAWLTEAMCYRMNQIPLKNYIKFLKLLGTDLAPALPARAHLTFTTQANTVANPVLRRTQISAQATDGGDPLIFETEEGLGLIQVPLSDVGAFDGAGFTNVTDANNKPGTLYFPFGWAADVGSALYLGFKPPDAPPPASTRLFPQKMSFRAFLPASSTAGQAQEATGSSIEPQPPLALVWEYRQKDGDRVWQRLNTLLDESAAFTREGYIEVQGPGVDIQPSNEPRLNAKPRYWIRLRIDSIAQPSVPQLDFLRPNVVEAVNLATLRGEILGVSDGHPSETYQLRKKPVQTLTLQTQLNGAPTDWIQVDDFLSSHPDDPHYLLNATAGTVQFGDGDRGRIPDASGQIVAVEYRYGGGLRGDVPPGAISSPQTLLVGVDKVTNERAAIGGADEQSFHDLQVNGPGLLRQRGRAVTPDDFANFAKRTGGVGAAVAIPLMHPDHPGVSVPGTITVVIVPTTQDTPPKPSADLIRALCQSLDQVRLLTTEVFVKGPEYHEVRVEARVTAPPYTSFDSIVLDIMAALNKALDPGQGKFGVTVYPTSLYGTILQVPNVTAVVSLNMFVDGILSTGLQPLKLPPDGMVYGGNHIITVDSTS